MKRSKTLASSSSRRLAFTISFFVSAKKALNELLHLLASNTH
jgi:hypothetical protein